MKITESQLRKLVEGCVREALEDIEMNEGFGWDAYKTQMKGHNDTEFPSWKDTKEMINGEPNKDEFRRHKERYDAAKDGVLYDPEQYKKLGGYKGIADDAAAGAVMSEPGIKGKLRRGAMVAGYSAGVAKNKLKAGINKGFNSIKDKFQK